MLHPLQSTSFSSSGCERENQRTQFDKVSNCAHDQETHSYCLRDLDEFPSVSCNERISMCVYNFSRQAFSAQDILPDRVKAGGVGFEHTLGASVDELCPVLEELLGDVC